MAVEERGWDIAEQQRGPYVAVEIASNAHRLELQRKGEPWLEGNADRLPRRLLREEEVPPVVSRAARRATLRTHRSVEKLGLLSVSMD
jgi:hypothetical protein